MRIPSHIVQEILERARIEEIVSDYVTLTPKGGRLWGLSPFKNEKTPSFTVTPEKNAYYCFSTQKGGGVVQFVMEMEGLTYPEALEYLAQKLGIELTMEGSEQNDAQKKRLSLQQLNARVAGMFHHLLVKSKDGAKALDYISGRGIDIETITRFQLGYAPRDPFWLKKFLVSKGYSEGFLQDSGLFTRKNSSRSLFSNRLMFPILDNSGRVVAFGGRILEGDGPKYLNSPETILYHKSSTIYGLWQAKEEIRKKKEAIVCEGYMDVLALSQGGLHHAVAPLGTAFTPEQATLLHRYAKEVLLLFDGDQAGINASQKALQLLESKNFTISVGLLSSGEDPSDILEKSGSQGVQNIVYSTSNALDFLLKQAVSRFPVSTPEGKRQAVEQLFDYIESINSAVKREGVFKQIAEYFELSVESLKTDFNQRLEVSKPAPRGVNKATRFEKNDSDFIEKESESSKRQIVPSKLTGDLFLMIAVVLNFQYFQKVRREVHQEDLRDPWAMELYIVLEESFRANELTQESILARIEDEDLISFLLEKQALEEFLVNPEALILDGIRQVKIDKLLRQRREIEMQLKKVFMSTDEQKKLHELLTEKIYIDQALNKLKVTIHDRPAE
ncbi:DNA primase [Spirochaeta lutea]|uniref:DNA primase n=1 Tax=Spirochaeta lutea TaxID=1480694 RepID=A0A098R5A9_9SPIO|nr:DNA primase [Spirochaeta lutea]KGE73927.1 hypothetical protein DC28_01730 [Spirochaeta lutea]